ncbi:MerR family transcriptional regulator, partial [Streptomyces roseolus]|uniref:MerR family transcriptional regulator n=1 Tax=Streptomyces roseolus TaxID=67358 RepID=UPI00365AABB4
LYTAVDLARIQRVLVYRERGVPLDDIKALLDAPATDATDTLRQQRDQLRDRADRMHEMAEALDRLIKARQSGILLSAEEQVEIFGGDWQPDRVEQVRDRWGDTPQWAQYAERAAERTAEHWQQIAGTVEALNADLAAACRAATTPGSEQANVLAERHRATMHAYFDCTHSMHVCLGRSYTTNPEFTAYYDNLEPGRTAWLRDIIEANARAHGIDPRSATWN